MPEVKCLCWNCGREILVTEPIIEVNEELWCRKCAEPLTGETEEVEDDGNLT